MDEPGADDASCQDDLLLSKQILEQQQKGVQNSSDLIIGKDVAYNFLA